MTIEFACQACGRLVRTPDAAAGKKGKCPGCGAVMEIPLSSPAAEEEQSPAPQGRSAAAADEKIEFPCAQCGHPVRAPASLAGKKGKCPGCGSVFTIPASPPAGLRLQAREPRPAADGGSPPADQPIEFPCPQCGRLIRTPPGSGGKKGKCPGCLAVVPIPAVSPSPTPRPAAMPGKSSPAGQPRRKTARPAASASAAMAGLTPLDDGSGLTPLAGLTPLDDGSGLTPVDDLGGLTPLGDLGGLTPLGDDPFAAPAGAARSGALNPYASPSVPSKPLPSARRRSSSGEFGFVEVLACTWHTFWDNWTTGLLAALLLIVIAIVSTVVVGLGMALLLPLLQAFGQGIHPAVAIVMFLVLILVLAVTAIGAASWLYAGTLVLMTKLAKGEQPGVGEMFQGGPYTPRILGYVVLLYLMLFGMNLALSFGFGLMAAVVGQIGMLLGFALMFGLDLFMVILLAPTPYLIVDQDKGVMEAFSDAAAAMKGKVLVTFALMLVVTLACAAVNLVTFSLGNLLTLPFLMLFWAVVYAKATGQKTAY